MHPPAKGTAAVISCQPSDRLGKMHVVIDKQYRHVHKGIFMIDASGGNGSFKEGNSGWSAGLVMRHTQTLILMVRDGRYQDGQQIRAF
jgi:hypothetical protein